MMLREESVVLERLHLAIKRGMPAELARGVGAGVAYDWIADRMVLTLHQDVLAEKLPPQSFIHRTTIVRHASWWEHLKATYRGRWWWPSRLSRLRYVEEPVAVRVVVRDHWKFPEQTAIRDLGRPVLHSWVEVVDEDGP